jgi:hypothetical protein
LSPYVGYAKNAISIGEVSRLSKYTSSVQVFTQADARARKLEESAMERWGAFSVVDHKDPIRLAIELLLYDKIALPTPADNHGPDWERWETNEWRPQALIDVVDRLKPHNLVEEVKWDLDRENAWRAKFEKAKSQIEAVNAEIRRGIQERIDQVKRNMVDRTQREVDEAIQAAAYAETRNEIIDHLKGQMQGTVAIWNGPVEFYSAYQSRLDFQRLNPEEDAVKQGVERVNFLIQHQLAVPDEPPEVLLDRTIKLAVDQKFKERRRLLYDYQINMLEQGYKPERILKDLNKLVSEYNELISADNKRSPDLPMPADDHAQPLHVPPSWTPARGGKKGEAEGIVADDQAHQRRRQQQHLDPRWRSPANNTRPCSNSRAAWPSTQTRTNSAKSTRIYAKPELPAPDMEVETFLAKRAR